MRFGWITKMTIVSNHYTWNSNKKLHKGTSLCGAYGEYFGERWQYYDWTGLYRKEHRTMQRDTTTMAQCRLEILVLRNTVRCRYNAVNLFTNIHQRHPIAHPLGRGMGCLLWVHQLIDILPQFLQLFMQYLTIWDRVITALDCTVLLWCVVGMELMN